MVHWYSGTLVHWYSGTVVLVGTLVHCYNVKVVHIVVYHCNGTLRVQW